MQPGWGSVNPPSRLTTDLGRFPNFTDKDCTSHHWPIRSSWTESWGPPPGPSVFTRGCEGSWTITLTHRRARRARRRRHGERCLAIWRIRVWETDPWEEEQGRPGEGETPGSEPRGPELPAGPEAPSLSPEPHAALTGTFRRARVLGPALRRQEVRGGQERGFPASLRRQRCRPWGRDRDRGGHWEGPGCSTPQPNALSAAEARTESRLL